MNKGLTLSRMIVAEMKQSKFNTLFCFLTVMAATSLLTALGTITESSVDATRRMMKDMGFNLLITAQGVDPARYQALDFEGGEMPEEYVGRLTASTVMAQHFVGKYQTVISLRDRPVVLTGVVSEKTRVNTEKLPMPMAYVIPEGKVYAGSAAAKALNLQPGSEVDILGKRFEVGKVLPEAGMMPEDIRIFAPLKEVQALLGKEGKVNAIDALACQCPASAKDIVAAIVNSIRAVLPDVEVHPYQSILLARHQQRVLVSRVAFAALGIVMMVSAAAIWGLTYQNVRNRRREIGVLRALGVPGSRIAMLFFGKILLYATLGAAAGCALGNPLGTLLNVSDVTLAVPPKLLIMIIVCTPLAAVLFALPPVVGGLMQEPVEVLGDREL